MCVYIYIYIYIVKNQRVNSCDQTFYYCQFRATQIVRYSSDKIA